jgi:multiple sugar transport system substrate-binding protein
MKKTLLTSILVLTLALPFGIEYIKKTRAPRDIPAISFWQYWSGIEKSPLEELVKKFNSEGHGFKVEMLSISMPRKKILMSIVGGVAPDLIHLDGDMVTDFALRNALSDLNGPVAKATGRSAKGKPEAKRKAPCASSVLFRNTSNELIEKDEEQKRFISEFIPIYVDMLNIHGKQYALPLMPTCEALHINMGLLAKHQLGEPRTLNDFVKIFDQMTDFKGFREIGWLPSWPPWAGQFIPVVFGGTWGKKNSQGDIVLTANSQENIRAWTWVQENFAKKIPKDKLAAFTEGFHAYQSPDNPFYVGKIALENNGVWELNLAGKFAPRLQIKAAPFPSNDHPLATQVTVDALAIPKGAQNPELAMQFIKWLLQQENLEYLALAQKKFTPLNTVSLDFIKQHPNPYIETFISLAKSPNAVYFPQVKCVQKYKREIKESYNKMLRLEISPEEALNELQQKMAAAQLNLATTGQARQ